MMDKTNEQGYFHVDNLKQNINNGADICKNYASKQNGNIYNEKDQPNKAIRIKNRNIMNRNNNDTLNKENNNLNDKFI